MNPKNPMSRTGVSASASLVKAGVFAALPPVGYRERSERIPMNRGRGAIPVLVALLLGLAAGATSPAVKIVTPVAGERGATTDSRITCAIRDLGVGVVSCDLRLSGNLRDGVSATIDIRENFKPVIVAPLHLEVTKDGKHRSAYIVMNKDLFKNACINIWKDVETLSLVLKSFEIQKD
jgi:hypothetical protein